MPNHKAYASCDKEINTHDREYNEPYDMENTINQHYNGAYAQVH